ncbi:MAG: type II toxin-antitoxin system VapC family toxin [Spirochaetaceae bacterium]|nr:type II toxin-antitoxin system VapC family toxin [Spirochaetaceae bacterium]
MIGIDTTFLVHLEIRESESHAAAMGVLRSRILGRDREAALAPQVLTEFVHIVTDPRRFERPLSADQAVGKAGFWWNAREVARVFPEEESVAQFLAWMKAHRLGRKRLLDTLLAATYYGCGITRIATSNARDYRTFGVFELIEV